MADIVYEFGGGLYVNLTNRCSNACTFCLRTTAGGIGDTSLWLDREPEAQEVIDALERADFRKYDCVVFCGYGEPTERWGTLVAVASYVKAEGVRVRINTNGHGSVINGRDIASELAQVADSVSISLNAPDAESYDALCRPSFAGAFGAMLSFARACKAVGIEVAMSAVDTIGEAAIARCRALCETEGLPLKVRAYIEDAAAERATRLV